MQVNLAGYNIDNSLIRKLNTETATPEVISAAYARISRSEKSITEIAYELNFESTGQFSTFFRHKTGTTPKEFRSVASALY